MEKVILFFGLLLITSIAFAQTNPPQTAQSKPDTAAKERIWVVPFPESLLNKIIVGLRKSKYPSDEIDEIITYITTNAREYNVPPTTQPQGVIENSQAKPADPKKSSKK